MNFKLQTKLKPAGDQGEAIKGITASLKKGNKFQTLLGVTGSGKTFTMANVIEKINKPTLVISPNKTLAAQLCNEFRELFPNSAVEYFVSYYDYYQPEAYLPGSDTYIEKESQINEEIDRLRHAATQAILTRKDTIIVSSVSCIYGLGSPKEYENVLLNIKTGANFDRRKLMEHLVSMQFERVDGDLKRGAFKMRGEVFEIMPVHEEKIYRVEIDNSLGVVASIEKFSYPARALENRVMDLWLFPAKHYVISEALRSSALVSVRAELKDRLKELEAQGKIIEAERLRRKTNYDLEMIENVGYCKGIENYSRHFDGRAPGEPPYTLLDYFAHGSRVQDGDVSGENGFLIMIDESHITVPQLNGMYNGDKARKDILVDHGFRLPSARDNRPFMFEEFLGRSGQIIFTSATPGAYELKNSAQIIEQIIRPTGLVDPELVVSKITGQVQDVIKRCKEVIEKNERALITTLTKKMSEDLAEHLAGEGIKAKYLHSDIDTLERIEILTDFRKGIFDVLVGVNLLREGLDLPEVSLVAILDADQQGFLRSKTSLLQTIGRAARNSAGKVMLYADKVEGALKEAIDETEKRRAKQVAYNKLHGITPTTIKKSIRNLLEEFGITKSGDNLAGAKVEKSKKGSKTKIFSPRENAEKILELELAADDRPIYAIIKEKETIMKRAAQDLQFELAAILRDEIIILKNKIKSGAAYIKK